MKLVLCALLFGLNVYTTAAEKSGIPYLLAGAILCLLIFLKARKEGASVSAALLQLMCYTLPVSWRSILGGPFKEVPVPWFYLFGLFFIISVLLGCKWRQPKKTTLLLFCFVAVSVGGLVPMFMAVDIKEGFSEYISLLFYFVVVFMAFFFKIGFTQKEYHTILKAYVHAAFLAALGIVIQYSIYQVFHFNIIAPGESLLLGGYRIKTEFLFADISSATIYIGISVIIVLYYSKLFRLKPLLLSVIVAGLGLSSARTGLASLLITLFIYALMQKHLGRKIFMLSLSGVIGLVALVALMSVRDFSQLALLDDNGRFPAEILSLRIWAYKPLFGIGFGDGFLSYLLRQPIPHFSLLKLLTQTGLFFMMPFLYILFYFCKLTIKNKMKMEFLVLFMALLGACFIPGLFSARFFTLVIVFVCIKQSLLKEEEQSSNYLRNLSISL